MAAPQPKMDTLVCAVVSGVEEGLHPKFDNLSRELAELKILLGSVAARMEMMGSISPQPDNSVATKRAVRSTATVKKDSDEPTVPNNSLLYFKLLLKENKNGEREIYATEEKMKTAGLELPVGKSTEDEADYYNKSAQTLWKFLPIDQKSDIRAQHATLKDSVKSSITVKSLQEEKDS